MLLFMTEKKPMLQPERINDLMDRRGWDVGILAYRSGVKPNTIYKYLNGSRQVQATLTNLVYLARALGCSVEYLIGMTDIQTPTLIVNLSKTQQEIIQHIGNLSSRRQRELAAMVAFMMEMDAQDREWIKRNLDTNEKLLGFVNQIGGEQALYDLLDSLGKPPPGDIDFSAGDDGDIGGNTEESPDDEE